MLEVRNLIYIYTDICIYIYTDICIYIIQQLHNEQIAIVTFAE